MINLNQSFHFFSKITFTFFILFFGKAALAQTPTIQDCLGAIPICTEIYTETVAPSGAGNYTNEVNGTSSAGGICCMDAELNSIWYTFTTNNSGLFGFTLTPNDSDDDYDWAMFNISNATCADIFNDASLQVSCNASGGSDCHGPTGANGMSIYNNQGAGCDYQNPDQNFGNNPHNALVPVQAGNTYVLVVSNWTGSTNGYTIDFGISSNIGIFDTVEPDMVETTTPGDCGGDEFTVTFSENIQCNTIDGSNFAIAGPGGPYSFFVSSNICNQGGEYDKVFNVQVSPPISEPGNYFFSLVGNGVDDALDLCDNPANGFTVPFEVLTAPLSSLDIGNDTILCIGEILTLDGTVSNADSYSWSTGSTDPVLQISQTGNYILSATNDCNTISDEIFINYVSPQTVDVDLGNDTLLCPGTLYELDATWENGIAYLWQDGFTGAVYTVTEPGIYEVQITGACDEMGSAMVEVIYDQAELALDLGVDSLLCEEDGFYVLDAAHENALNYQWGDGSTNPTLQVVESGIYNVTISDDCTSLTDEIALDFTNCTICNVFVPNAFSPNFDGYNDDFRPYSNCLLQNYSLKIFNRWGALIFETSDIETGWNGRFRNKDIDEGVYIYLLEFEFNQMGEVIKKTLSGDVTAVK